MPELHSRIRQALSASGHALDEDIVEELAQHAETAYESARAEGQDEAHAASVIEQLVREWAAEPQSLRRVTVVMRPGRQWQP